jgi:calcium-translocating P-type ATPase
MNDVPEERAVAATRAWHAISIDQTLQALDTSVEGLSSSEVSRRLAIFGSNIIPESPPKTVLAVFLGQFKNAFIYLLLVAAAISLALGEMGDALFIAAALLINATIGTVQEWQAQEKAMALKTMVKSTVAARRDGNWEMIDGRGLVPGDIVEVTAGIRVPAALRLLVSEGVEADEALLTGESVPVKKDATTVLGEHTSLGDIENMVHAGTTLLRGRALGVVTAIGLRTEVGKVAQTLKYAEEIAPPLIGRMRKFTHIVAGLMVGIIALIAFVEFQQGTAPATILMTSVALAVAAIPEGLPVALTVALAISVTRMSRRHVIVRKMAAVEGLGACTLIAADKTGTLTMNTLSVERVYLPDFGDQSVAAMVGANSESENSAARQAFGHLVVAGMLCNEARLDKRIDGTMQLIGDTVDGALLRLGNEAGFQRDQIDDENPRKGRIPYEPEQAFAATYHETAEGLTAYVKGAAEVVSTFCSDYDREELLGHVDRLARQGYRVLALAEGRVGGRVQHDLVDLKFLGLVALIDPLRPVAAEAVRRCRDLGVAVRMITGDHPLTALEIGRQLGMADSEEEVVTGSRLAALAEDPSAFDALVLSARVFARISPMQKLAIVQSLQRAGHIVAVTGDGVNDASALAAADIGAAMGRSGTDIARSAADLIILDDDLSSLADGIEEGRIAYDNVRKVIYLLVSTGAAELVLFLASISAGLPLPLTPVQLLWLNLVTQGIQDVALAFEKGEPGVADRKPRPPNEGIFNRQMIEQTVLSGLLVGGAAFILFSSYLDQGLSPMAASNQLLLVLILFENAHVFNCRSETRSAFAIPIRNNPFLVVGVVTVQLIHLVAMNIPWLNEVLDIRPLSFDVWVMSALPALSVILVMELYKVYLGRTQRDNVPLIA